jgi:hypothetical protein
MVGNLVSLVSEIAARGEKTQRNERNRDPQGE